MKNLLITLSLMLSMSGMAEAAFREINTKASLLIIGPIDRGIESEAERLLELTRLKKKSNIITIHIDSPGGNIFSGMIFVQAMLRAQSRGYRLICSVAKEAQSMAMLIYGYCDERYALTHSILMWHPPATRFNRFTRVTPLMAKKTLRALEKYERTMNPPLRKQLGIPESLFYLHYHEETQHYAIDLLKFSPNFLILVDDYRKVYK